MQQLTDASIADMNSGLQAGVAYLGHEYFLPGLVASDTGTVASLYFRPGMYMVFLPSGDALLSNARKAFQLFGYPQVGVESVLAWIADWVERGDETLGKPTHFENRAGNF